MREENIPDEITSFFDHESKSIVEFAKFGKEEGPQGMDFVIMEVRHYKSKQNVEHEFLIVEVERKRDPGIPHHDSNSTKHVLLIERSRFSGYTSTSFSSVFPAKDTVRLLGHLEIRRGFADFWHIQTAFFDSYPKLIEFSYLLDATVGDEPDYKLAGKQCYWLCSTVMTQLSIKLYGHLKVGEDHARMGTFRNIPVPVDKPERDGRLTRNRKSKKAKPHIKEEDVGDKSKQNSLPAQVGAHSIRQLLLVGRLKLEDIRARDAAKDEIRLHDHNNKYRTARQPEGRELRDAKELVEQTGWMDSNHVKDQLYGGWVDNRRSPHAPAMSKMSMY